jgi:TonB family protein
LPDPKGRISTSFLLGDPNFDSPRQRAAYLGYEFEHRFSDALDFQQNARFTNNDNKANMMWPLGLEADAETLDRYAPTPEAPPEPVTPPRFDAAYLNNPAPAYPPTFRRLHEHGVVLLRVRVTPEGHPAEVLVERTSGSGRLDSAAINAVQQWKFVPARRGSEPAEAWVIVPLQFELRS